MGAEKIKSLDEVCRLVREGKAQGNTFALANGIFDVLHVGHVRYLQEAARLADVLIVAVNSDRSAAALKGRGRPVICAEERAEIISALECVDCVLVFDDSMAEDVILALKPDVHVKGTDYTAETVPEREMVLSYGGRVAIAGDRKTHSSTEMIERICRRAKGEQNGAKIPTNRVEPKAKRN